MKFSGVIDLLEEERSVKEPKYELITPENYTRGYMENRSKYQDSYLMEVRKGGELKIIRTVDKNSKEVEDIKLNWERAIVLSGIDLIAHLKSTDLNRIKTMKKYDIRPEVGVTYKVNDFTDIIPEALKWDYWLEPNIKFRDFTSNNTTSEFEGLMDEL